MYQSISEHFLGKGILLLISFNIQDLRATLEKVDALLQLNLNNPTKGEKSELPTLAQTAIDLTHIMIPSLPPDTFDILWNLFFPLLRLKEDPNMQRRAYRCLAKLAEVDAGKEFLANRLDKLTEIIKRTDIHTTSQKALNPYARLILGSYPCPSSNCRRSTVSESTFDCSYSPRGSHCD